ncbi:hypothetical protein AB0F25_17525 [Streptomyces wedmorensis]|uniref:hypothetical protein n=1 Tax=Streptomyces wedmorensis TaxID=43759 RepID=UPI00343F2611
MLQIPREPLMVRVHTPVGVAAVLWRGDPERAEGRHLVEWTAEEDVLWGQNAGPAAVAGPDLRQEGDRVVMRGLFHLTGDGAAYLQMGDWPILFDLASPVPDDVDGTWVEISVAGDSIALYPYRT